MKSRCVTMLVGCLFVAAWGWPAVADEENEKGERPRDRDARPMRIDRHRDPVAAGIRFAEQLREAVMAKLTLDEGQREAIKKVFDEHLEEVRQSVSEEADEGVSEDVEERARELELKARAARKAGDREEALRLHREIRELRHGPRGRSVMVMSHLNRKLVRKVTETLDEDQATQVHRLAQELRTQSQRDDPVLRFMREVRRLMSELDLSAEQRRAVGTLVREAMKELDRPRENAQAVDELMAYLRPKLHDELGAELAQKFVAALEEARQPVEPSAEAEPARAERTDEPVKPEQDDDDAPEPDEDEGD